MGDEFHNRKVTLADGFTIDAMVHEDELEGTDEEFLERNPKVREIAEEWAAEVRERKAAD